MLMWLDVLSYVKWSALLTLFIAVSQMSCRTVKTELSQGPAVQLSGGGSHVQFHAVPWPGCRCRLKSRDQDKLTADDSSGEERLSRTLTPATRDVKPPGLEDDITSFTSSDWKWLKSQKQTNSWRQINYRQLLVWGCTGRSAGLELIRDRRFCWYLTTTELWLQLLQGDPVFQEMPSAEEPRSATSPVAF